MFLNKTSVPKRKHFQKRKKVQNEVKRILNKTVVPKRKKVQNKVYTNFEETNLLYEVK